MGLSGLLWMLSLPLCCSFGSLGLYIINTGMCVLNDHLLHFRLMGFPKAKLLKQPNSSRACRALHNQPGWSSYLLKSKTLRNGSLKTALLSISHFSTGRVRCRGVPRGFPGFWRAPSCSASPVLGTREESHLGQRR